MFNYKELIRFNISLSDLPEDSIIINEPYSFYKEFKLLVWTTVFIIIALILIIFILQVNIVKRKKAELALVESHKSLEELIYIASHDLQTPLVSMEGYTSDLLDNYKDRLDENGIYSLTRLKSNASRMHKLVLSLLDISRLNTNKYPYELFSTRKIVNEIIKDLSITIENTGVKIKIEKLPEITGDKQRIQGVFRRLITNAITFGGKKITIGYDDGVYFVQDDGIGIPENQLEKIFLPGERLKKLKIDGIGMGLTFCRKIISQHGGKIWAESDGNGKGSTFYFKI